MRRSAFDRILQELQQIRYRLDDVEAALARCSPRPLEISESELLLLPDHLRKTYMFVVSRGECSAKEASNYTDRCRAMESSYLNQLVRMGWLTKHRDSKTTRFRPISGKVMKEEPQPH